MTAIGAGFAEAGSGGSPAASFAPATYAPVGVAAGTVSAPTTTFVFNTQSTPLTIASITISGPNAAEFRSSGSGTTPCVSGGTVPRSGPGNFCNLNVSFAPLTAGPKTAAITVTFTNTKVAAVTLTMTPTAIVDHPSLTTDGSVLVTDPLAWGGTTAVGDLSVPFTFPVMNNGSGTLILSSFSLSGDFVFATANNGFSNCQQGILIGPLSRCLIGVEFRPTAVGNRTGTLTLVSNDPVNPIVVYQLSGVAIAGGPPPPPPPPQPVVSAFDTTDVWGDPAEAGWSLSITHHKATTDQVQAYWHTFDADGRDMWVKLMDGHWVDSTTFTGNLHRAVGPAFSVPYDPTLLVDSVAGTATLSFTDVNTCTLTYSLNGVSGTKTITRVAF